MSDIIHLLPDSVANQIAAGEVIPVSYTHLDVYKRQGGEVEERIWVCSRQNGYGRTDTYRTNKTYAVYIGRKELYLSLIHI